MNNYDPSTAEGIPEPAIPDSRLTVPTPSPTAVPVEEQPPLEGEGVGASSTPSVELAPRVFEDFFPKLTLTEEEEKELCDWFNRDLRAGVRHIKTNYEGKWAKWRLIFMLEYVEKMYPSISLGPDFASGVLCDKTLDAMNRLKTAIYGSRPYFCVDDRVSNMNDMDVVHRLEWFFQTVLERDINLRKAIGLQGLFDFVLDGSLIVEADQMYEKVPMRTLETILPGGLDKLMALEEKALDKAQFQNALLQVQQGSAARVLVEKDVLTKDGLQVFVVDKVDHIIPPNVYRDEDVRFRGRRMYLTRGDLELLSSDSVKWYDRKKVEKVLDRRFKKIVARSLPADDKNQTERINPDTEPQELFYDWENDDTLTASHTQVPYTSTWAIYRVLCKYGYVTKEDPKGLIPKWCVFDYDPESQTILRSCVYPHFHENPNYFHFKMGYAPQSYYGFGFGARLTSEDLLESNAVGLYLEGTALATIKPFLCVSPEFDGVIPFMDGFGPGKVGMVRNMNEFKTLDMLPPPNSFLSNVIPMLQARVENRTGMTSLVQGRTESTDPRSPASKTTTLLKQALVTLDSILEDWSATGWEPLAQFIWKAEYEKAVFEGKDNIDDKIVFPGLLPEAENVNRVTLEELGTNIQWKSQATSNNINAEVREAQFLRQFQFFSPLIQQLAKTDPQLYRKYFLRWMRWAGQELQVRGMRYLLPSEKEIESLPPDALAGMQEQMLAQLKGGASPQNASMGEGGEG